MEVKLPSSYNKAPRHPYRQSCEDAGVFTIWLLISAAHRISQHICNIAFVVIAEQHIQNEIGITIVIVRILSHILPRNFDVLIDP